MPDENGTETTRTDAPSADDSLFGDAAEKADDAAATVVDEQDATEEAEPDAQGAADDGDKSDAGAQTGAVEELKVVVSIKGDRAIIGVQRPSSDPHIETFEDHDLPALAQEVTAVTERARARWEEAPKHPAYERPAPPVRSRNRRRQGAAQASTAEGAAEPEQAQTPRLF
ncbi:MAG: hypothetical protein OXI33_13845 [Chloroflexota bacterium]|nr:hypothetical protein [Chloroflexota bacterium]